MAHTRTYKLLSQATLSFLLITKNVRKEMKHQDQAVSCGLTMFLQEINKPEVSLSPGGLNTCSFMVRSQRQLSQLELHSCPDSVNKPIQPSCY